MTLYRAVSASSYALHLDANGHKFSAVFGRLSTGRKNAILPIQPAFDAPVGMITLDFHQDLWHRNARVTAFAILWQLYRRPWTDTGP